MRLKNSKSGSKTWDGIMGGRLCGSDSASYESLFNGAGSYKRDDDRHFWKCVDKRAICE